jgi:hypothetical protein
MIKLTAPDGYKLKDKRTGKLHSEVVTDDKNRDKYELVPNTEEINLTEIIGG